MRSIAPFNVRFETSRRETVSGFGLLGKIRREVRVPFPRRNGCFERRKPPCVLLQPILMHNTNWSPRLQVGDVPLSEAIALAIAARHFTDGP